MSHSRNFRAGKSTFSKVVRYIDIFGRSTFSANRLFCPKMNSGKKQITELFKESTVLTIAHRLNTIIHSDRIVILEKGMVVEFDSPAVLIDVSDNSFFGFLSLNFSAKNFLFPKSGRS